MLHKIAVFLDVFRDRILSRCFVAGSLTESNVTDEVTVTAIVTQQTFVRRKGEIYHKLVSWYCGFIRALAT